MSANPKTISEAKLWCKEGRKLLQLSGKEDKELDLKSRASRAEKNLRKLDGQVPQGILDRMEGEFIEIAGRIRAAGKDGNKDQARFESARLNVVASEAQALRDGDDSSRRKLGSAMTGLAQSLIGGVGTGTPDQRGDALAKKLMAMAEKGESFSVDLKALAYLAATGVADSDEQKTADIACKRLAALEQSKARTETPSDVEREAKRMPSEVMVHLLASVRAQLKTAPTEELKKLERSVNAQIMKHDLSVVDTKKFLATAKDTCNKAGVTTLEDLCKALDKDLPATDAEAPVTRLHDNPYGRVFDSALISNLVKTPPDGVKKAIKAAAGGFQQFLATADVTKVEAAAADIQHYLKGEGTTEDPRFWIDQVPDLVRLRDADPTDAVKIVNEFLAADKKTGPECIAVPWLMVKMSTDKLKAVAPWMPKANANYQFILDARFNVQPKIKEQMATPTNLASEGSGITLKHQPTAVEGEGYTRASTRPANKNLPGVNRDKKDDTALGAKTEPMRRALEHGLPYGSGASGSTNVMLHLLEHLNTKGANIDTKDMLLGTSMFLIADGGHSLQEVLYAANAVDGKLGLNLGLPGGKPEEFVADYGAFVNMFGDTETGKVLQKSADSAMDRVTEYFEEHSYYSKQDKGSAATVTSDWQPASGAKTTGTASVPVTDTVVSSDQAATKPKGSGEAVAQPDIPRDPDPAPVVFGNLSSPNPTLYFVPNSAGKKNFRVESSHPGGNWQKVEQFCSYLAAFWLSNNKTGGLKFSDLGGSQSDAVDTLVSWGDTGGGLDAQVAYAKSAIGGKVANKFTFIDQARTGKMKAGTKIWYGTDDHSKAARVLEGGAFAVYNPTSGSVEPISADEFANRAMAEKTFVVAAG
jgi:hypothetical protein